MSLSRDDKRSSCEKKVTVGTPPLAPRSSFGVNHARPPFLHAHHTTTTVQSFHSSGNLYHPPSLSDPSFHPYELRPPVPTAFNNSTTSQYHRNGHFSSSVPFMPYQPSSHQPLWSATPHYDAVKVQQQQQPPDLSSFRDGFNNTNSSGGFHGVLFLHGLGTHSSHFPSTLQKSPPPQAVRIGSSTWPQTSAPPAYNTSTITSIGLPPLGPVVLDHPQPMMASSGDESNGASHRAKQRIKQINFGKITVGYRNYRMSVPTFERQVNNVHHPRTPDILIHHSKRKWDTIVAAWRRSLHVWDTSPSPHSLTVLGLPTLHETGQEQKFPLEEYFVKTEQELAKVAQDVLRLHSSASSQSSGETAEDEGDTTTLPTVTSKKIPTPSQINSPHLQGASSASTTTTVSPPPQFIQPAASRTTAKKELSIRFRVVLVPPTTSLLTVAKLLLQSGSGDFTYNVLEVSVTNLSESGISSKLSDVFQDTKKLYFMLPPMLPMPKESTCDDVDRDLQSTPHSPSDATNPSPQLETVQSADQLRKLTRALLCFGKGHAPAPLLCYSGDIRYYPNNYAPASSPIATSETSLEEHTHDEILHELHIASHYRTFDGSDATSQVPLRSMEATTESMLLLMSDLVHHPLSFQPPPSAVSDDTNNGSSLQLVKQPGYINNRSFFFESPVAVACDGSQSKHHVEMTLSVDALQGGTLRNTEDDASFPQLLLAEMRSRTLERRLSEDNSPVEK